jgi:hypothetical protein
MAREFSALQEICRDPYQVKYDPATATVVCTGNFRLPDQEYTPILAMLNAAADTGHDILTLDVRALRFLNSSGINVLLKFALRMRQQQRSRLVIKGNPQHPWQLKSLKNLQRLLPGLRLELE